MKKVVFSLFFMWPIYSYSGTCDYPDQLDSAGRRCGKRAASVRSGGHLDGDGSTNVGPDDVFSGDEDVIIEFKPPLAGSNSKKVRTNRRSNKNKKKNLRQKKVFTSAQPISNNRLPSNSLTASNLINQLTKFTNQLKKLTKKKRIILYKTTVEKKCNSLKNNSYDICFTKNFQKEYKYWESKLDKKKVSKVKKL